MAKTFTQFMEEANISVDYIETRLFKMGYTIKRDSSRMVSVLVDTNRIDALQKISKEFADLKAYYDPNKGSSSVGAVVVGSFTIKARPASKQGKKNIVDKRESRRNEGYCYDYNFCPVLIRYRNA